MKILSALLIISLFVFSCDGSDGDAELVGKWTIKDYYVGTGANNDSYRKATSEWTLEFFEDGTVHSSELLCSEAPTYDGTYDDQHIQGNGCPPRYSYYVNGQYLIIYGYVCIESCHSRFVKNIFLNP